LLLDRLDAECKRTAGDIRTAGRRDDQRLQFRLDLPRKRRRAPTGHIQLVGPHCVSCHENQLHEFNVEFGEFYRYASWMVWASDIFGFGGGWNGEKPRPVFPGRSSVSSG